MVRRRNRASKVGEHGGGEERGNGEAKGDMSKRGKIRGRGGEGDFIPGERLHRIRRNRG